MVTLKIVRVCLIKEVIAYRAVMVFRTQVTVFLTPADLIETTAANLTHGLIGRLVHSCQKIMTFHKCTVEILIYLFNKDLYSCTDL